MIIKELTMNNFRQFYGTQSIEFAHSQKEKIVTVIHGENGRGKTGIYRAMMFALFGDAKLAQDSNEADIYLGNIKAAEEKKQEGVHGSVTLKFNHRKEDYILTRTYFAILEDSGMQKEQQLEARLVNENTKESWGNEKDIQYIIRQMIDERVKHYFFFDGERIERLTRVSAQQKEEISVGIKNLLKIDQVLKSKAILSKLHFQVQKELERHSTGDYKKALRQVVVFEEGLQHYEEIIKNLENNKKANEIRLDEINQTLQNYESMKADLLERERLEIEQEKNKKSLTNEFEQMKTLNKYLPLMIGEDIYLQEAVKLASQLGEGAEGEISSSFIQSMLQNLQCMCGTSFEANSKEFEALSSLQKSVLHFEEHKSLYNVQNDLKQLTSYLEGRKDQIQSSMEKIESLYAEKEQIKWQLEELNRHLSSSGEIEIKNLNQEREQLVKDTLRIEHNLSINREETLKQEEDLRRLKQQLVELEQKSGIHQQLLEKHQVLADSVNVLTKIIQKFETDIIEELEFATTQNLKYLLDIAGQSMIKEVQVNTDYTLEILNTYGQPFLANISQGQRQVLSLSFITALAQVAGGDQSFEMPLFMDTPFGRLSSQHQRNLIEYLPEICSQWVLLVTDKEFGSAEHAQFMEANTIGRYYELIAEEAGITTIKELIPSMAMNGGQ